MDNAIPRILGMGYAVPANIRTNDDPIFDWLKTHNPKGGELFKGYKFRRVLADSENLMTIMVPAALHALREAQVDVSEIDLLLGCASISPYQTPNELGRLHQQIGLPEHTWVLPLSNDFSNFNAAIALADSMIRANRARNVLIAVGGSWTRAVNYHTPQAISAADGAGAIVMGVSSDSRRWTLVDQHTLTHSNYFGTMFMAGNSVALCPPQHHHDLLYTAPYFQITSAGQNGFVEFGEEIAPKAAQVLLDRWQLKGEDITLISHQASNVLLEQWQNQLSPSQYINTIEQYANMTVANIPVNLAWAQEHDPIQTDSLVLLAIGLEMHANALLLQRK
ncbi:3-oxoacyl-ACP synthase [Trichocoleus sp. FACHB-591]|uniref:3-oxoacyl-ACP synthase III family protein n=1 Tax=Trichocoleus sp. FACHB-591 TaxID=2692872 RepID=UPI001683CC2B|nr:3-oxoacyl-[acyl-carrier-protein] synthase III C-terminal domain-containing protein [Trichocoleus sp. FACHB-591]MBD2098597.1 3-oxoacyl-ACP synthase [Trichocoleus sp. FACHB-591]